MKVLASAAGGLLLLAWATAAGAETFPDRPIKWIVPYGPGGGSDISARMLAKILTDKLGQPVIVENKPSAGGVVAAEAVANAKPDGYTMLFAPSGPMGVNPSLYKKLSYSVKSFKGIHGIASTPNVYSVNAAAPYKTFKEMVDHARKHAGTMNYSSVGVGTTYHLAGELLAIGTDTQMTHVPYKATSQAITDLLGNNIQVHIEAAFPIMTLVEGGKLRPLAVAHTERLPVLPDVPTTVELGYPGIVMSAWTSAAVPAATPQPVIDRLVKAFSEAMSDPEIVKFYSKQGSTILNFKGAELDAFYVRENANFKELIDRIGLTAD